MRKILFFLELATSCVALLLLETYPKCAVCDLNAPRAPEASLRIAWMHAARFLK